MGERWKPEEAVAGQGSHRRFVGAIAPEVTLVTLVTLVVMAFIGAAVWIIVQAHQNAIDAAESRNIQRTQALDEGMGRFLRENEHLALHIATDYMRLSGGAVANTPESLAGFRYHIGHLEAFLPGPFGLVDADGRVALVTEERWQPVLEGLTRAHSDVFRPPSQPEPTRLVVLRPAITPTPAPPSPIFLCWRVSGGNGGFAVVITIVDVDHLRGLFANGAIRGSVALLTSDGDVLFQQSARENEGIGDSVQHLVGSEDLHVNSFGSYRGRVAALGPEVLMAFRHIGRFPLVVATIVRQDEILAPWRAMVVNGIIIVLGLSAMVAVIAVSHLRAVARSRHNLETRVTERTLDQQRAAERLLAAERLTHLGHWEHDLKAGDGYWSAEIYQIFGLAAGRDFLDLKYVLSVIHPDDCDAECTARILASAGVKPYNVQFRIKRPDGVLRYVHAQAEVLRNDHDVPVKLIGTILDVTDRVNIERRLCESEEKYRKTFEAAQDALFLLDRDAISILDANESAARIYGYERMDFQTMPWSQLVVGGSAVVKVEPGSFRHRRQDGGEIFVDLSVAEAEFQGRVVDIVAVRDVTQRVEAEARLALTTERLNDAERTAHLGYWDWNSHERIHHWSDEQWRMLGLEPDQVEAGYRTFIKRVHPEDRIRLRAFPVTLSGDGASGTIEFRILRPDGLLRYLHATCRIERDTAGNILRLFSIQIDVTERKKIENALAESNAAMLAVINATQEDSVMLISADGRIQVANERAARSFKRSVAELHGMSLSTVLGPEASERWNRTLASVIATGQSVRFEQGRDDAVYDAHLSPASDPCGQLVGVAVFERDITARKQAESSLRLLTRAIEQSPLSVIITKMGIPFIPPQHEGRSYPSG